MKSSYSRSVVLSQAVALLFVLAAATSAHAAPIYMRFAPLAVTPGQTVELCYFNGSTVSASGTVSFQDLHTDKLLASWPYTSAAGTGACWQLNGDGFSQRTDVVGFVACDGQPMPGQISSLQVIDNLTLRTTAYGGSFTKPASGTTGLDDWLFAPVGITDGTSLEACVSNGAKTAIKGTVNFYDANSGKLFQSSPISISGGTGGCVSLNGGTLGTGRFDVFTLINIGAKPLSTQFSSIQVFDNNSQQTSIAVNGTFVILP